MISEARLRGALAEWWGLSDVRITVHNGGMNSATWFVDAAGALYVAKAVPSARRPAFVAGLAVASCVDAAGIPAGAPRSTRDGATVVDVDGVPLAVLRHVDGVPLSGMDDREQSVIGATLARVHAALVPATTELSSTVDGAESFHWVDPTAPHLDRATWLRPAVTGAVEALADLDPATLTTGLLHTDPAPEAFRWDGVACGLIDWSVAVVGPLLYDLASAVMYVGGPDHAGALLRSYRDRGVLPADEVERGLATLLRFRWAVQADYFARRLADNDLTGIASAADNERGLDDARRHLAG